jgi:hypothetical protein
MGDGFPVIWSDTGRLMEKTSGDVAPIDVQAQRVLDSLVAQSIGVIAVGLTFIGVHVAFNGGTSTLWAYAGAILACLVLVAVVNLLAWYVVRRPSPARTIKRELVAARLKALRERELPPRRAEHVRHG